MANAFPTDLTLYMYDGCPFCARVTREAMRLGVELPEVDIDEDATALSDLVRARGRRTVPVLRITQSDGTFRWMPESADIVRYLQSRFAQAT